MVTLFNQEKVMEIHDYHVAEAARKDGVQEGRAEGALEGTLRSLQNLIKNLGLPVDKAMSALGIPDADQPRYAKMLEQQ